MSYIPNIESSEEDISSLKRPERLLSCIRRNLIPDIGKFKETTREINLNADKKRFWLGRIESIDDKIMNDSMPLSMNHFTKKHLINISSQISIK